MRTLLWVLPAMLLVTLVMGSCSPPPSVEKVITQAIKTRRTVLIFYAHGGGDSDGAQVVEPHVLGTTQAGEQAMRAWFLHDIPKSQMAERWRLYLLKDIRSIELAEPFEWPRPDYDPTGGKAFKSVEAAL